MIVRNDIVDAIIQALSPHSRSYKKLLDCIENYEINIEHPISMTYQQQKSFIDKACVLLLEYSKLHDN